MSFTKAAIKSTRVNPVEYHKQTAERGELGHIVSSSTLRLFRQCPQRWLNGYEPPDSESKDWGNLIDCLVLTRDLFKQRFAVQPSEYERDGEKKAWRNDKRIPEIKEWLERNEGKQIIKAEEYANALQAAKCFAEDDETIREILAISETQVHVQAVWQDEETGLSIPCQCLIDFVPHVDSEWRACLGDLKTGRSALPVAFNEFAYRMGYHVQAAFDMDMYEAAMMEGRNTWLFALQENFTPWQTGRRMYGQGEDAGRPGFVELGRQVYEHALARYAKCLKTGVWPDYDSHSDSVQGFSVMYPTQRMIEQTLYETAQRDEAPEADEESEPNFDSVTP